MRSQGLRRFALAICATALFGAGVAQAQSTRNYEQQNQYVVIREDASIPLARRINSFRVDGNALLLRVGVNHWYRAEVSNACARDLRWAHVLPLVERSGTSINKFSYAVVEGRRCYFESLDEIENPFPRTASAG